MKIWKCPPQQAFVGFRLRLKPSSGLTYASACVPGSSAPANANPPIGASSYLNLSAPSVAPG